MEYFNKFSLLLFLIVLICLSFVSAEKDIYLDNNIDYVVLKDLDTNKEVTSIKDLTQLRRINLSAGLRWFTQSHPNMMYSNYYTDRLVYCRDKFDHLSREFNFSNKEIIEVKNHCKTNNCFNIRGAEIPSEVQICKEKLFDYLKSQNIEIIDPDLILDECLLRKAFKKEFSTESFEYINTVFSERNSLLLKEINYVKEEIFDDAKSDNKKIEKEKIYEKINKSYYRDESSDLDFFKQEAYSKNESLAEEIEKNKRDKKPKLEFKLEEVFLNFRGLLNKFIGLIF